MLYARLWVNQNQCHDITSIWDWEPDAKSISGAEFWKAEGRVFSFTCAVDGMLTWLMHREINNPLLYQIKYGIRKCYVQVFNGTELLGDGYLQADSFETEDLGERLGNEKVELVKVKFYDLLSCIINYLSKKEYHLTGGTYSWQIYQLLRMIITGINDEDILIWPVWMINNWQAMSNFPYNYNDLAIFSITNVDYAPLPYPWDAVHLQRSKSYIIIENGSPFPIMRAVRWRQYEMSNYGGGSGYAWYETIHFVTAELRGAQAVVVHNTTDSFLHISGGVDSYELYELFRRYSLPSADAEIAAYQQLVINDKRWTVSGENLLYTGPGYIDQIQIGTSGDYNCGDVVAVLLNVLYGWLDCSGHRIRLKNKVPLSWIQANNVIIDDAAEFTQQSRMNEISYDPSCDWLASRDGIVAAINQYYSEKIAGLMFDLNFTTCCEIDVANYFVVRGWIGYAISVKPVNPHTTEKQVTGIGIRLDGSSLDETIMVSENSLLFETTRNVRSVAQTVNIIGINIREKLTLTTPAINYPPPDGTAYNYYYVRLAGTSEWSQTLDIYPDTAGEINVNIEVSFLPLTVCENMTGTILCAGIMGSRQIVVQGTSNRGTFEQESEIDFTDWHSAYSLRKLRESYSGPCMTVTNANTDDATDIGFDEFGMIDTAAILALAAIHSNVRVYKWYNQAYDAEDNADVEQYISHTTAGGRPLIASGGSLTYDGLGNLAVKYEDSDRLYKSSVNWWENGMHDDMGMFLAAKFNYYDGGSWTNHVFCYYAYEDFYTQDLYGPSVYVDERDLYIRSFQAYPAPQGQISLEAADRPSIMDITVLWSQTMEVIDGGRKHRVRQNGGYESIEEAVGTPIKPARYDSQPSHRAVNIGMSRGGMLVIEAISVKRLISKTEIDNVEGDIMFRYQIEDV